MMMMMMIRSPNSSRPYFCLDQNSKQLTEKWAIVDLDTALLKSLPGYMIFKTNEPQRNQSCTKHVHCSDVKQSVSKLQDIKMRLNFSAPKTLHRHTQK